MNRVIVGSVASCTIGYAVLGILGAMLTIDARLTAVMLLIGPPLALFVEVIRRILRKLYLAVRTNLADLNAYLAERLHGVRIVQL